MNGLALARPAPAPSRAPAPCARSPSLRRLPHTRPLLRVCARARARPQRTGPAGRPYWLSDSPNLRLREEGGGAGRERAGGWGPGGRRSRPRANSGRTPAGARPRAPLCARASQALPDGAGWPRARGVRGRANFSVRAGSGVSARGSRPRAARPRVPFGPCALGDPGSQGFCFPLISEPPHVGGCFFSSKGKKKKDSRAVGPDVSGNTRVGFARLRTRRGGSRFHGRGDPRACATSIWICL